MELSGQIPTLPDLALQYGTINDDQHKELNRLFLEHQENGKALDFDKLLMDHKMATGYQIGLLKLIREFLIIKHHGEIFGKIAIEKGLAMPEDVQKALEHQKKEFKRAKLKKMIGDILVENGVITIKQKNTILKEQAFIENQADQIFDSLEPETGPVDDLPPAAPTAGVSLDNYEKNFLKIKALDQDFAARLIEKKIASKRQVTIARRMQEEELEKSSHIRILGDIMVEMNFITNDQKNLILKEQQRIEPGSLLPGKKIIDVTVSPDLMEAVVAFDPDDAAKITIADIKTALKKKGIKEGIYSDAILQCNLDMGNTSFVAARQDFSMERVKQKKTTYYFNTRGIDPEKKDKGATLAQQQLGNEVYLKKNLFGNNIEQYNGHDGAFRCGSGTRLSSDKTKAFAGKTGFPSLSIEKRLFIHPSISVHENADLRYGPLEAYANLTISGILTGAYPVTAGNLEATEIRDASITAIGNIVSQAGITDAVINAQGDIRATYVHGCRIETFGNVYIENEIIDSQIFCSGKIESPNCRIISSTLYGKKGVEIAGAGSSKTAACVIGAGTEHHLIQRVRQIERIIKDINREVDELKEQRDEQLFFSKRTFQKMVELKIFHDRAKEKKQKLSEQFKLNRSSYSKRKLKNIVSLIHNYEKRKAASISSLKELNQIKIKYDKKKDALENKIKSIEPRINRKISTYRIDINAFFEWARKQENISQVAIHDTAHQGTVIKGVFSSHSLKENMTGIRAYEKDTGDIQYKIIIENKL